MKSDATEILHPHWFIIDVLQHVPVTQKLEKKIQKIYKFGMKNDFL